MLQESMPEADRIIRPRIRCNPSPAGRFYFCFLARIGCECVMMVGVVTSGGRMVRLQQAPETRV